MLKAFIANPDLSTVEVEERYRSFAEQKRKDNYETVPCHDHRLMQPIILTTLF